MSLRDWLNRQIAEVRRALRTSPGPHIHELNDLYKMLDELLTACEKNPKNIDCSFAIIACFEIIKKRINKE